MVDTRAITVGSERCRSLFSSLAEPRLEKIMSQTQTIETEPKQVRWALVAGAILTALGVLAILAPFFTGLSLAVILGAFLVVGAIVHVAQAFSAGSFRGAVWQVVLGIVYGAAGITFMANPVVGLATLTILAISFFVLDGAVEVGWAFAARGHEGWLWLLASGIVSLLVAGLLWVGFPSTALWAVGVLFGVNLLSTGATLIMLGMAGRQAARGRMPAGERRQKA